jgi:hypothetical protein
MLDCLRKRKKRNGSFVPSLLPSSGNEDIKHRKLSFIRLDLPLTF